jgi:hypothetical protein
LIPMVMGIDTNYQALSVPMAEFVPYDHITIVMMLILPSNIWILATFLSLVIITPVAIRLMPGIPLLTRHDLQIFYF